MQQIVTFYVFFYKKNELISLFKVLVYSVRF